MSTITTLLFRVRGVWQRPPEDYQESPLPIAGYNLAGKPKVQGYKDITFVWSHMDQEDLTRLFSVYDPEDPKVEVRFIDRETGAVVVRFGMMHEPIVGGRSIIYYKNIALKFTRITDS